MAEELPKRTPWYAISRPSPSAMTCMVSPFSISPYARGGRGSISIASIMRISMSAWREALCFTMFTALAIILSKV